MAEIVILGAGLTGLSAAYHLEKRGFFNYAIFEKEKSTGGLCRSINDQGFTFDFTGHLIHINNEYFRQFIQETIGLDNLYAIDRRSFVYSHDTYTRYPFQINLYGLPPAVIVECIEKYVHRKKRSQTHQTFIEWVHRQFGAGFAKHFFVPFQQKIFAHPLNTISAAWTGRFVPKTSLQSMLFGALTDQPAKSIGYNANFLYPKKGGIQSWIHTIQRQIANPIHLEYQVKSIDIKKRIVYFTNHHSEPFNLLINTMPLDTFISCIKEPSNVTLKQALIHLKCNSVINFNLGINQPDISDKHWIYFPEKKFPFYRVGFPHNFSPQVVPPGCSSLYGEFSYLDTPAYIVERLLLQSLKKIKKLLKISDQEIILEKIIPISHAYVIYTFWREKYVPKLLKQLQDYNIISTGRYGAWKYASMQESILDGKHAAEFVTIKPAHRAQETEIVHTMIKQKEITR